MSSERLFPDELLHHPPESKLAYYDSYTIAHPYLQRAFEALKPIIRHCGESRVIFIVGPTGVGKTTLRLISEKWILEESLPQLENNRGYIPVASVEAKLQKSGLFNVKDYLRRCLYALEEPENFIKNKINYRVSGVHQDENGQLMISSRILETDLAWALEQALINRRPKIFFIDEAHHMLAVTSGRRLTDVPEAIKSLANLTGIPHGMIGTYDLLMLQDIGDQLSRRSVYIHLPRYNPEFIEDREDWKDILWTLQNQIPTKEVPDFLSHWDYLLERSLGCVGILKNWSKNALFDALEEGANTITLKHLDQRSLSPSQCMNILKKVKSGEQHYSDIEKESKALRLELGLESEPVSRSKISSNSLPVPRKETTKACGTKRDIGLRNPKRDPVGDSKS